MRADVFRIQIGDVGLRTAQMPAQLVKVPTFQILFSVHDKLMFLRCDGPFGTELNFRPKPFGNERSRQPTHRQTEVVELSQMDVGTNRADLERLE